MRALKYIIILMMCTLIAVVLTGCNAAFLSYCFFFYLFYDGILMWKYEPFCQEVSAELESLILR